MPVVQAAQGSFTATSATTFEVTHATEFGGNTPKGGLIWTGNNTVTGTVQDDGYFGLWGFTDNEDIVGCLMRYRHDFATSDVRRTNADGSTGFESKVTIVANNSITIETAVDCTGDGVGSNPGAITNGWRFSVDTYTADVVFHYLLVGGDDLETFKVTSRINTASNAFVHGLSKTDRILGLAFFGNEVTIGGDHTRTSIWNSFGVFSTNDGGTTFHQASHGQREVITSLAQDINGVFSNQYLADSKNNISNPDSNTNNRTVDLTAVDATEFTIDRVWWETTPGSEPLLFLWGISIPSSMNVWSGHYTMPTTGGTFTPSSQPGFQPGVYGLFATGHTNTNTYEAVEGSGALSFGVQDANGNNGSASLVVEGEMLNIENTYARSLTSTNFLDLRTVSGSSESVAAQFSSATFTASGIEVSSPTGTFGGYGWAFAFELADDTPIDDSVTESLVLTDSVTAAIEFNETITDQLVLTDTAEGAGPLNAEVTDTLILTDQAADVSPFFRTIVDTIILSDSAPVASGLPVTPTGQRGGRTFEDVRAMRAAERLQVLARQDQQLLEFLKKELNKL